MHQTLVLCPLFPSRHKIMLVPSIHRIGKRVPKALEYEASSSGFTRPWIARLELSVFRSRPELLRTKALRIPLLSPSFFHENTESQTEFSAIYRRLTVILSMVNKTRSRILSSIVHFTIFRHKA
ncbi:hypothetical protein V1478_009843 [Vespula squamosa]|uniref:Uncharacterized protein n=1 Tax=Vespula squamosa TaxID=30214 RepID=A0ABD2AJJ9_VESSQ